MVAVHYTYNQTLTEVRMLEVNVDFSTVDPLLIQECQGNGSRTSILLNNADFCNKEFFKMFHSIIC